MKWQCGHLDSSVGVPLLCHGQICTTRVVVGFGNKAHWTAGSLRKRMPQRGSVRALVCTPHSTYTLHADCSGRAPTQLASRLRTCQNILSAVCVNITMRLTVFLLSLLFLLRIRVCREQGNVVMLRTVTCGTMKMPRLHIWLWSSKNVVVAKRMKLTRRLRMMIEVLQSLR